MKRIRYIKSGTPLWIVSKAPDIADEGYSLFKIGGSSRRLQVYRVHGFDINARNSRTGSITSTREWKFSEAVYNAHWVFKNRQCNELVFIRLPVKEDQEYTIGFCVHHLDIWDL